MSIVQRHARLSGRERAGLFLRIGLASATVLAASACGPGPSAPPPLTGGLDFEGSWNASGTRQILAFDGGRRAAIVHVQGAVLLTGPQRRSVGFRGEAIALSDSQRGLTGRAVWTDERGDRVFSELQGEGTATGNRITGTFVGGTGRYAGAAGSYQFTWQYVLESDDGTIQGRAVGLKGHARGSAGNPGADRP